VREWPKKGRGKNDTFVICFCNAASGVGYRNARGRGAFGKGSKLLAGASRRSRSVPSLVIEGSQGKEEEKWKGWKVTFKRELQNRGGQCHKKIEGSVVLTGGEGRGSIRTSS